MGHEAEYWLLARCDEEYDRRIAQKHIVDEGEWTDAEYAAIFAAEGEKVAMLEVTSLEVIEKPSGGALALVSQMVPVDALVARMEGLHDVMKRVMKEGHHYGKIPGTGDKPSLLKPGAEMISATFQLSPEYTIDVESIPHPTVAGHREYRVKCRLVTAAGGFAGEGVGSCSTLETKYRYRSSERTCPECGNATIIKGRAEYGGGFLCFAKKGGCGAKFKDGDPAITEQSLGRIEHENPADYWNTCEKMAAKRAFVDAVKTATGASDIFTQDIEDLAANGVIGHRENGQQDKAQPKAQQAKANGSTQQAPSADRRILAAAERAKVFPQEIFAFWLSLGWVKPDDDPNPDRDFQPRQNELTLEWLAAGGPKAKDFELPEWATKLPGAAKAPAGLSQKARQASNESIDDRSEGDN